MKSDSLTSNHQLLRALREIAKCLDMAAAGQSIQLAAARGKIADVIDWQSGEKPGCGCSECRTQRAAPETPAQSPTWAFVERVATCSDYTHDDVDELKILKDLQAAAALLYGDGSRPEMTIQQTGWWQCPCCQNYYTPERIVCPVSGDSRPTLNGRAE